MTFTRRSIPVAIAALVFAAAVAGLIRAADHNDGNGTFPGWDLAGRRDANLTNFFAFRIEDNLVMIAFLNAGITDPEYFIAEDLTLTFHIDTHSEVTFGDGVEPVETADWMMRFGGTVTEVDKINSDIRFAITFRADDSGGTRPRMRMDGLPPTAVKQIRIFPGPGESPLRGPNAIVALEVPLALVGIDNPLLLWVTTKIPDVRGPISDHMGMPNTSNQRLNLLVNLLRPRDHAAVIGARPSDLPVSASLAPYADVLIYDLSRHVTAFPPGGGLAPPFNPLDPSRFPNGRPIAVELRADPFVFPYIRP